MTETSKLTQYISPEAYVFDDSITYDVYLGIDRTTRQEAKFRLELAKRSFKKDRQLTMRETRSVGTCALKF